MAKREDKRAAQEILSALNRDDSIDYLSEKTNLPSAHIRKFVRSAWIMIGANDGLVDAYLEFIDDWEESTGRPLVGHCSDPKPSCANQNFPLKASVLDDLTKSWSPNQMRDFASSMIKLADSIDQRWSPHNVQSAFNWPSVAARIERNSLELAKRATLLLKRQRDRADHIPAEFLGEPAWNMLLELFIQFSGGASISCKSLTIVSGAPATTALRYLDKLEEVGLVKRSPSKHDRRVNLVSLTSAGVLGVGQILEAQGRY